MRFSINVIATTTHFLGLTEAVVKLAYFLMGISLAGDEGYF
jgi:hypothetical protein